MPPKNTLQGHSPGNPERIRTPPPSQKIDFLRAIRGLGAAQLVRRAAEAGAGGRGRGAGLDGGRGYAWAGGLGRGKGGRGGAGEGEGGAGGGCTCGSDFLGSRIPRRRG
jgi:hypothetical protein